jgi:DNA processing protein
MIKVPLEKVLALIQTPKIGPVTFHSLIQNYGTVEAAFDGIVKEAKFKQKPDLKKAEKLLQETEKRGIQVIYYEDMNYPPLLKTLREAPPLLFVQGNCSLLQKKAVALVGARNASYASQKLTYTLARDLSEQGYAIISGFAQGIDFSAHKGAQPYGSVAVFAGGIDHIFPPEHERYVDEFLTTGVIISEMPLGHRPNQQNFPRRNRLISGLAMAVVVIEAAHQSGSLITAEYALAQGREVGAVPGSPLDVRCRGSNRLLKQGAHFVENSWDVLTFLNDLKAVHLAQRNKSTKKPEEIEDDSLDKKILTLLSYSPIDLNDLLGQIPSKPQEILSVLSSLELSGKVIRSIGNKVALKDP